MKMENQLILDLIHQMDTDQKIGALLTLGFAGTVPGTHIYDYITKYHCGGLRLTPHARTFGSYINPKTGKSILDVRYDGGYKKGVPSPYCTASQYKQVLDELQETARKRPLGIPLHFSFDQEGSDNANFTFGGVNLFPKPMGIRSTGNSRYAFEIAKAVGQQSKAVGFSWIHSPVLDINSEPSNTEICTRAYSDDPQVVTEYAEQTCRGFKEAGMICTGKHFPGRGASAVDAHFEVPVIDCDRKTLFERDLVPYRSLIAKDLLPAIMLAHTVYPALDPDNIATVSKKIITGLLREELGFEGVITTDSMTMGGVATRYGIPNACAMALEAGADIVLMKAENNLVDETFNTIRDFVNQGRISAEELDRKVYRVLDMKYRYGLFDISESTCTPEQIIADPEIVALSRDVALRSVLIARDRKNWLPLSPDEKALVIEQFDSKKFIDYESMPGMLYYNCLKYNRNLDYLETAYMLDEDDRKRIDARVGAYNTIILTNYTRREVLPHNALVEELVRAGKKVILITNTPYALTIPDCADCVVVTFSHAVRHIEVVAGTLFGATKPLGQWPILSQIKP
jgi:beta-N-acetylhexosaminidase